MGMRESDRDEAGLILEDDGTVWLVSPDGTRAQLGAPVDPATLGYAYYGSITGAGSAESCGGTNQSGNPSFGVVVDVEWNQAPELYYPRQGPQPFDLSDPTNPVVLESGIYSFSCEARVTGAHEGKFLTTILNLERYPLEGADFGPNDGPGMKVSMDAAETLLNVSCARYLLAGATIHQIVEQNSADALNVDTWMQVQRLA